MQIRAVLLAAALVLAPIAARAADLVIWWEEGFYPEEDQAARELIQAFETETGRTVELVFQPYLEAPSKVEAALAAGQPPDLMLGDTSIRAELWAGSGALADLSDVLLPIRDRFLPGLLELGLLPDPNTGRPTHFTVPVARASVYVHVWTSLLERAGFTLTDIPNEWEPFWSFWCDKVQPAVRKTLGRDDIWSLGLAMSADSSDTADAVTQFMIAYQAYFWPASNQRQLDNPTFRPTLIKVLEDYTAPWRKGCVPPDAVHWRSPDNNKAFLEQRIVMTTNGTLSIPAALRIGQPDDYYQNTATISWPSAPDGRILPLLSIGVQLVIFSKARDLASAKEFVRFLLREERLGAWFEGARGRWLPTLVELAGSPFWTDPSDPHRLPAVEQLANPSIPVWGPVRASLPSWWDDVGRQLLLGGAVHRIAADGLTPEQAVDELIAKLRQFQSK